MAFWIRDEFAPSGEGKIDFHCRHNAFLDQSVGDDRNVPPMKEIQDPIMNSLQADSQFVNAIPQIVSLGPAQFVPNNRSLSRRNRHLSCASFDSPSSQSS